MANDGWIKLHRQLQDSPLWKGEKFTKGQAWVDLLLLANHKDNQILFDGKIMEIKRGEFVTSVVKLSEKWKWNRRTVSSYLNMLEKEKMIHKYMDNRKTLITIENYEVYQCSDDSNAQLFAQQTAQQNTQQNAQGLHSGLHTNKNDKNDKNDILHTYIHSACACEKDLDIDSPMNTEIPIKLSRM